MPPLSHKPKVALITGAPRRIGAAIARALHAQGYTLALHYRSEKSKPDAQALQADLNHLRPDSAHLLQADLTAPNAPATLIQNTLTHLTRIDALINNASVFFPTPLLPDPKNPAKTKPDPAKNLDPEAQWNLLINTNLKAPYFLIHAAAPHLKKTQGAIINIADLYATRPLPNHSIYCATKAGLYSLTQSLAQELAPQIRVNAIAPGAILWPESSTPPESPTPPTPPDSNQTPAKTKPDPTQTQILARTPLARLGDPTDIANAVTFLLTQAPFITGQLLQIDGGRSAVSS